MSSTSYLFQGLADNMSKISEAYKPLTEILASEEYRQYISGKLTESMSQIKEVFSQLYYSPDYCECLRQSLIASAGKVASVIDQSEITALESEESLFDLGDDYIELSEPLAESVVSVNNSIDLPKANKNNKVHISKSDVELFAAIISVVFAILSFIVSVHSNKESSIADETIIEILQQIEENTSTDQTPE